MTRDSQCFITRNGTLVVFLFFLAIATLGWQNATIWAGVIYQYDPSLGTLPEAQGFTRNQNLGTEPAPTVSGGLLHQFPSGPNGTQFWSNNSAPLDFSVTSYVLEANLHVLSSNYIPNIGTGQRSGYYLGAVDSAGRSFHVGISSTGITINTDAGFASNNGVPFTPFNTTDAFHIYRLVIDNGDGSLYIDGSLFATTPLGGAVNPGVPNRVIFGDLSGQGVSETELRNFQFGTLDPVNGVPEPGSLAVMFLALAIGAPVTVLIRRRNGSMSSRR